MNPGSSLSVITARGKICDRDAIATALKSGQLAGYAGDVWFPQVLNHTYPPHTISVIVSYVSVRISLIIIVSSRSRHPRTIRGAPCPTMVRSFMCRVIHLVRMYHRSTQA